MPNYEKLPQFLSPGSPALSRGFSRVADADEEEMLLAVKQRALSQNTHNLREREPDLSNIENVLNARRLVDECQYKLKVAVENLARVESAYTLSQKFGTQQTPEPPTIRTPPGTFPKFSGL